MDVVTHILKDDFAKLGVQRNMENLSDSSVKGVNIWLYKSIMNLLPLEIVYRILEYDYTTRIVKRN